MDVKSGYPWWPVRNGLLTQYPQLREDRVCDVAVIGGGISGALIADALCEAQLETVVLDKRDIGWGSTAASTALLQFEIDTELLPLSRILGEKDALRAYRACERAVEALGERAASLGDIGFARCESVYFAGSRAHLRRLRAEYEARARHFDVAWLEAGDLAQRYGLTAPAAIVSRPAARVDPYRFAHALLACNHERGLDVFDRSEVVAIEATPRYVHVRTRLGTSVRARHVVIAAGYESESFLPSPVARNRSTYALVSEPFEGVPGAFKNIIAWETRRPYVYWRMSEEGRLILGGADDSSDHPSLRDARVGRKTRKLMQEFRERVPAADPEIAFAWAGAFAETADGLPYFGAHPSCDPRVLFAMAYGGNGITYSMTGASILRAAVQGIEHELAGLFGFARLLRNA